MNKLIDIVIPSDQQEGTESSLSTWLKEEGEFVEANEAVAEVSTDKAVVEIAAPVSGILRTKLIPPDTPVSPGTIIGRMSPMDAVKKIPIGSSREPRTVVQVASTADEKPAGQASQLAHPAVARLAAEHGIELKDVKGSGRGGRITQNDLNQVLQLNESPAIDSYRPPTVDVPSKRFPHDQMRRNIARHMQYSVQVAPHVTSVFECDLSAVLAHRQKHRTALEKKGHQLTLTTYFIAASVKALDAVPEANSKWHDEELEIFSDMNIGVGTSLGDKGLVVPVIHRAQTLDLNGIAARLTTLTAKARDGKLTPNDMSNGTFTLSNHGVSGSLLAAPIIIHQPQSAILGLGKLERRPVVVQENDREIVSVQPRMYVTLTIDHRALDAHQTNRFLGAFVTTLEKWAD